MTDFSCWFCKSVIEKIDVKAVAIEVSNLWVAGGVSPSQTFSAHSECAKTHLSPDNQFDPEDLLDLQ